MQIPSMFPRFIVALVALSFFSAVQARGQKHDEASGLSFPPPQSDLFEVSLGYNYIYLGNAYPETRNLSGLEFSAFVNATSWLAVGGEFMAGFGTHSFTTPFNANVGVDSQRYVYVFGPRITIWHNAQFRVFAEALAGAAHAEAQLSAQSPFFYRSVSQNASDDSFAIALGAGFDWRIANHVSWRIMQGDYLGTDFGKHWQDNCRVSTSMAFSFGRR